LVGGSVLHYVNWTLRSFDVCYWGRTQYLGKGLIREGFAALVSYAIEHILARREFLTMDERNLASRRLADRVGFEYEG
ncbi:GNAT family N-acetyltransferase, partial [Pseudomonas syringae group genomosp. 7]|uniref:GNAT family N-acetyltransferase n=1 Tax=Pseudomonas syringae group genomosp. 7 TaxID=251699 RepID=UPI00376F8881